MARFGLKREPCHGSIAAAETGASRGDGDSAGYGRRLRRTRARLAGPAIERQTRIGRQLLAVSSGGSLPAQIAATMSGARNFSRTIRDALEGVIFSSPAIWSRFGPPISNSRLPIFCARTSSRIKLVSAGAEIVGPSTMNFISFPVRFNRAGMVSLTRSSSLPASCALKSGTRSAPPSLSSVLANCVALTSRSIRSAWTCALTMRERIERRGASFGMPSHRTASAAAAWLLRLCAGASCSPGAIESKSRRDRRRGTASDP